MPTTVQFGKAFELAILKAIATIAGNSQEIEIMRDATYDQALNCYESMDDTYKDELDCSAEAAVRHTIQLEPRIDYPLSDNDILTLKIQPDSVGIAGDVRDIIIIRSRHGWEIGISAKHHHEGVKHSRLSNRIDFGQKWVRINCSRNYFDSISPIFERLNTLRQNRVRWSEIMDKEDTVYLPLLNAFKEEMNKLFNDHGSIIPERLLQYLIGLHDFYKVIKKQTHVKIQAFNINGTLNKDSNNHQPLSTIPILRMPSRIIEIVFKPSTKNTVIMTMDHGWSISFRIHNATTMVEPSLKFDIKLVGQPTELYTNHIPWVS